MRSALIALLAGCGGEPEQMQGAPLLVLESCVVVSIRYDVGGDVSRPCLISFARATGKAVAELEGRGCVSRKAKLGGNLLDCPADPGELIPNWEGCE